jgi:hypothetical protein
MPVSIDAGSPRTGPQLLANGELSDEGTKIAMDRRQYNGNAARVALGVLERHAKPTKLGEKILGMLRAYWADVRLTDAW